MTALTIQDLKTASVAELVRAAQTGQRDAFGELFERFKGLVLALAVRRLRDYNEAQELCQDVFIQALQKIKQLREPECFVAWLRAITTRMAINRAVRRHPDCTAASDALANVWIEGESPLGTMVADEQEAQLHAGLSRLRDLDRKTLEAFYVQGRSLVEMSDEFEAPLGTIKRRLHVARKRLAEELEAPVAV
jgi:RNA polymerase sigma-70 factor (ECF subfamily)